VVVTRGDVGDQRTEHIEGCLVALFHLLFDVELDLVQRHVPRSFDHHLHVMLPSTAGQFAEGLQLSQLSCVRGIVLTARTQGITQGEGAVIALEDLADVVEAGVERVLLVVVEHPLGEDAAAAAHDSREATLHLGQVLNQQAGVDGLVIDPLLAVLLNDVQEVVFAELLDRAMHALEGLIHRHGADGHR